MTELYDRLVNDWTLKVTVNDAPHTQHFAPLITILGDLVAPSKNSRGGGGQPSTRNLVDVKALDLLTHIQDVSRAWLQEWGLTGSGNTRDDIVRYRAAADALHHAGAIETADWERLTAYPDTWAGRIWDLLEPPLQRPLRDSECPRCGSAKTANEIGETIDALVLEQRYGQAPTAVCRVPECTGTWVGEDGLKSLGRELGIEFNTDALITEESGVTPL